MGASHFVWIGNTPQEIKKKVFIPFKNFEAGVVINPVLFFPHINQT